MRWLLEVIWTTWWLSVVGGCTPAPAGSLMVESPLVARGALVSASPSAMPPDVEAIIQVGDLQQQWGSLSKLFGLIPELSRLEQTSPEETARLAFGPSLARQLDITQPLEFGAFKDATGRFTYSFGSFAVQRYGAAALALVRYYDARRTRHDTYRFRGGANREARALDVSMACELVPVGADNQARLVCGAAHELTAGRVHYLASRAGLAAPFEGSARLELPGHVVRRRLRELEQPSAEQPASPAAWPTPNGLDALERLGLSFTIHDDSVYVELELAYQAAGVPLALLPVGTHGVEWHPALPLSSVGVPAQRAPEAVELWGRRSGLRAAVASLAQLRMTTVRGAVASLAQPRLVDDSAGESRRGLLQALELAPEIVDARSCRASAGSATPARESPPSDPWVRVAGAGFEQVQGWLTREAAQARRASEVDAARAMLRRWLRVSVAEPARRGSSPPEPVWPRTASAYFSPLQAKTSHAEPRPAVAEPALLPGEPNAWVWFCVESDSQRCETPLTRFAAHLTRAADARPAPTEVALTPSRWVLVGASTRPHGEAVVRVGMAISKSHARQLLQRFSP